jgi:hypothetical protein
MATAAAVAKPKPVCLADKIQQQMEAVRDHHYLPLGLLMRLQLGISDDSAYFQDAVRNHLAPISRLQGLMLDWPQDCSPQIAELQDGRSGRTQQFIFPRGVGRPPRISDPRFVKLHVADPEPPSMTQDVDYYASGLIYHRNGTKFYVLQPVEQLAVRPYGAATIILLRGRTNIFDGTKVALLFSPFKKLAFLVGGMITFD